MDRPRPTPGAWAVPRLKGLKISTSTLGEFRLRWWCLMVNAELTVRLQAYRRSSLQRKNWPRNRDCRYIWLAQLWIASMTSRSGSKATPWLLTVGPGLSANGLCNVTRGSRFHHVLGNNDKGKAVNLLAEQFRHCFPDVVFAGLGDSPNDIPMLRCVDIPIIVKGSTGITMRKPAVLCPMCGWQTETTVLASLMRRDGELCTFAFSNGRRI
jgi:hypothetical protein